MVHQYDPSNLLDSVRNHLKLKNDAELSRTLEIAAPLISKMRSALLPISGSTLIRMHEVSGLSMQTLRDFMGDRRKKFRLSGAQGRPPRQSLP